ncbi:hypothetical protein C8F04DRAFT_72037 [Mycena alexandri]|uniref:Uncharacterized protein n=1 Tax=Mycena alexandri TaxID=1745969 RepID=A0AAD6WWJ8_9AGAR|nr:hypothetical protein C8F04DRAFT_72037 [Mycena alexandri]
MDSHLVAINAELLAHPSTSIPLALLCATLFIVLVLKRGVGETRIQENLTPRTNPKRTSGEWISQPFDYPEFDASHALSDIKPPMYRPFRWGEYHVMMGIRSMQWVNG